MFNGPYNQVTAWPFVHSSFLEPRSDQTETLHPVYLVWTAQDTRTKRLKNKSDASWSGCPMGRQMSHMHICHQFFASSQQLTSRLRRVTWFEGAPCILVLFFQETRVPQFRATGGLSTWILERNAKVIFFPTVEPPFPAQRQETTSIIVRAPRDLRWRSHCYKMT